MPQSARGRTRELASGSYPAESCSSCGYVARRRDRLRISRRDLGRALHNIKARSNLRAADRVVLYDDGAVTDQAGEPLGNIYDEI
jgi:hypothetical protein